MQRRPIEALKERRVEEINRRYDAFLAGGYPLADYPGETLQCRNELDRTNWLTLKDICFEALMADLGDALIPAPGIRCTSNNFIQPTFAYTFELMRSLRAWAFQAQANWWRLKDLARSQTDWRELEAMSIDEGWP